MDIFLILFSIFIIFESYKISGNDLNISSPGAFPLFISIMMLVFSIWIYSDRLKKSQSRETGVISMVFNKDLILFTILLILYGIILQWAGFIISTVVFLWTATSFLSKGNYIRNLGISLIIVTTIMIVFNTVFKVTLP